MADSLGLQISKAVEARLKVASVVLPGGTKNPPTGLTVERGRLTAITHSDVRDGPLIIVSMSGEPRVSRDHFKSPKTDRTLELDVGIFADATSMPVEDAVDPAYNWAVHALQSDPTLGGLAHFIHENASRNDEMVLQDAASIVGGREVKVHIEFHTRTDDPEVRNN